MKSIMKDKRMRAAIFWGGALILSFVVMILIFFEPEQEEVITGPDTVENYDGPIVGFEPRARGVKVTVRDLKTGDLGSGFLKYDESEKWEEIKEIVENEEYDTVIELCLEYSSKLVEEERYHYYGYPIAGAWLYKVDEISEEFSGEILTYFENEIGKLVVIRDMKKDKLVYLQFSEASNLDEKLSDVLESETCGVEIVVSCKFYEYVNYEGYPVVDARIYKE